MHRNSLGQALKTPKLFQSYLNYGAKVCSEAAIDRVFKTIDYLVILDIEELSDFCAAAVLAEGVSVRTCSINSSTKI